MAMKTETNRITEHEATSSLLYDVEGMSCASCAARLETLLNRDKCVIDATVNYASKSARIIMTQGIIDNTVHILAQQAGFTLTQQKSVFSTSDKSEERISTLRSKTIIALVLSTPVFIIGMFFHHGGTALNWISMILTATVLGYSGNQFFVRAWQGLRHWSMTMDTLVALSTGIAFAYSAIATLIPSFLMSYGIEPHVYFESAAIIAAFILLGKLLEENAQQKTGSAIKKLIALRPSLARVMRDTKELMIPTETLLIGDEIIVKSGESIPADGLISFGNSFIDESSLTGEFLPTSKAIGDTVFMGTINTGSVIHITAHKVGDATVLAEIIRRVHQALSSKAPIERYVNKVASVFVPTVIGIAVVTCILWIFLSGSFAQAFIASISVLVIACPCALGLATPTALITGIGRAAELGILIKDAAQLETAATITHIAFDKTGTLTQGIPTVTDAYYAENAAAHLPIALRLAQTSSHPLSIALVKYLKTLATTTDTRLEKVETIAGLGTVAHTSQGIYRLGSRRFMEQAGVNDVPETNSTSVFLSVENTWVASWTFRDSLRENAKDTLIQLQKQGIQILMLTGDKKEVADEIGQELGIKDIYAELLPSDKASIIRNYQSKGHKVAFVGDGINDAESLAIADMGLALASGTDIAIETAGATLMRSDIATILSMTSIAKATVNTIRFNLLWAFGYNVVIIPVAAGILYPLNGMMLHPMIAGAAMAFSSVSVVLNSLRLKYTRLP